MRMRSTPLVLGATLLVGVLFPAAARAGTDVQEVDCNNPGKTIRDKIKPGSSPLEIIIAGMCNENVVIDRDNVTLKGDPATGGTINGVDPNLSTVLVDGVKGILIDTLRLTGARNGIASVRGGGYTVRNSSLDGNAGFGAVANFGARAAIVNSQVVNNGAGGLLIINSSVGTITGSTIAGNTGTGVSAQRGSTVLVGANIVGGLSANTIQNNSGSGVSALQSSHALVQGNTIDQNAGGGVTVVGSHATIVGNTITAGTYGVNLTEGGFARVGVTDATQLLGNVIQNSVRDGVLVANGSSLVLGGNTIQASGRHGLQLGRSTARLVGQNTIETSAQNGIFSFQGSIFQGQGDFPFAVTGDVVRNNGLSGVVLSDTSSAGFESVTVTGNNTSGAAAQAGIFVGTHSSLRIRSSSITGNNADGIRVINDSGVAFATPPASVNGNTGIELNCTDLESSAAGNMSLIPPPGPENNCSGF